MLTPLQETLEGLEDVAVRLREYDNGAQANAVDRAVREVRTSLPELLDQAVSHETAARIEGQTEGTIGNRVSRGDLTNVGTREAGTIPLKELRVGRSVSLLLHAFGSAAVCFPPAAPHREGRDPIRSYQADELAEGPKLELTVDGTEVVTVGWAVDHGRWSIAISRSRRRRSDGSPVSTGPSSAVSAGRGGSCASPRPGPGGRRAGSRVSRRDDTV